VAMFCSKSQISSL